MAGRSRAGTLLPRSVLFNAALYAFSALVYTLALFSLEASQPGRYVFPDESQWRNIFSYVAICSWPILLFGALILIAVRIGAKDRRQKNNKNDNNQQTTSSRALPPSTQPPTLSPTPSTPPPPVLVTEGVGVSHGKSKKKKKLPSSTPNTKKEKKNKSRLGGRIPTGYVSVTRTQRIFAAVGFLWVALGLSCTVACSIVVFLGLRERSQVLATEIGVETSDVVKEWILPIVVGGIVAVIYAVLSATTLIKFWRTITAPERTPRERRARARARATASTNGSTADLSRSNTGVSSGLDLETPSGRMTDLDGILADESDIENDLHPTNKKKYLESRETPDIHVTALGVPKNFSLSRSGTRNSGSSSFSSSVGWATEPDPATIDTMMTQLRNMGYTNEHQNIAALQAASYDIRRATEKLANIQQGEQ